MGFQLREFASFFWELSSGDDAFSSAFRQILALAKGVFNCLFVIFFASLIDRKNDEKCSDDLLS
jgi:hypothetical protein